jgi:hypothetical protein
VAVTAPGCIPAVLGYLGICAFLYWVTRFWLWPAFAAPGAAILIWATVKELSGLVLLAESRRVLLSREVRCLVVYSESSTWDRHSREAWLPRLGQRAVALNWSERSSWPATLEVRLFEHFVGSSERNFQSSRTRIPRVPPATRVPVLLCISGGEARAYAVSRGTRDGAVPRTWRLIAAVGAETDVFSRQRCGK